ncbi:MAG: cupin domain-containing protein [Opitutaceae bacterium]|nr:cupin domain-containing protein [Cytophagales bacterium]
MTAEYWIEKLNLSPHPEGGFYRETYRSLDLLPENTIDRFPSDRNIATAIYFLLPSGKFSAFHRIFSDELWFFHAGTTLLIHSLDRINGLQTHRLGLDLDKGEQPQITIPARYWFGAQVENSNSYALVSCTVAPGFDFLDFEMGKREKLSEEYPENKELIKKLTY